ncbi:hypothetical protein GO986_09205 [Deinococcus sp. HMF7620]|uniref:Lipoprotein n=1 Tax=Deinococcus arboris TaxID=2682977 RepID=A0A7C9M1S5_9DEIO|nr:hypothetical protein [Deinococcus arboris]MVN86942.1 hypothetical protein [Deinococcus arboris]
MLHECKNSAIKRIVNKVTLALAATAALALSACAPKYTAATAKPVSDLSCAEMKDEQVKLASIRSEAQSKKGISKENVFWAVFFWPGAVVNELDNREVIEKVDARSAELTKGQSAKNCAP